MLTEFQIKQLQQKLIPQEDIDNMEEYDEDTGLALFKDGRKRVVTEGVYTRIMGYYRRIEDGNTGKRQEMAERKYFKEDKALDHLNVDFAAE